jgi:hypothetical protein
MRDGLKLECDSKKGSLVMGLKKLLIYKLVVTRFVDKKVRKGVVHGIDLDVEDYELKDAVISENPSRFVIEDVKRIGMTKSVILTFKGTSLPEIALYGYKRLRVNTYIPKPIRCFNCQRFGHMKSQCKSRSKCAFCGGEHDYDSCDVKEVSGSRKCANCDGNHTAGFTGCPNFQNAQEIVKVKTVRNISFADAVKVVKNDKTEPETREVSHNLEPSIISSFVSEPNAGIQSSVEVLSSPQVQSGLVKSVDPTTLISVVIQLFIVTTTPSYNASLDSDQKLECLLSFLNKCNLPLDLRRIRSEVTELFLHR